MPLFIKSGFSCTCCIPLRCISLSLREPSFDIIINAIMSSLVRSLADAASCKCAASLHQSTAPISEVTSFALRQIERHRTATVRVVDRASKWRLAKDVAARRAQFASRLYSLVNSTATNTTFVIGDVSANNIIVSFRMHPTAASLESRASSVVIFVTTTSTVSALLPADDAPFHTEPHAINSGGNH
jgi:hypothetical protein